MARKRKPDFVIRKSAWSVAKIRHFLPLLLGIAAAIVVLALYNWDFAAIPFNYLLAVGIGLGVCFIPFLWWVVLVINIKDETISFYGNKVVRRSGIFREDVHTHILTNVLSVKVSQSFWERFFRYGTITIEVIGPWDIDLSGIKNLKKASAYLESIAANGMDMQGFIMN